MRMARVLVLVAVLSALPSVCASQTREPVVIAAVVGLTGVCADNNAPSLAGMRLGVTQVNEAGGVLGRPLKLLVLDNQCTPIGSKVAARRAVMSGAAAIVGPVWSSHALAAARVAQEAGLPMVANIATHNDITRTGDFIFRVCFTDSFQGRVMAGFAYRDLKARTAVMAVDAASDYSLGLAREFKANFTRMGGRMLGVLHYKADDDDFSDLVEAVGGHDPDVLFMPGHDESGHILSLVQDAGIRAVPLGGDGWVNASFFRRGGSRLKRAFYCTHWHPDLDIPASREMMDKVRLQSMLSADFVLGFDAVRLVAQALSRAGNTSPRDLRDALAATEGFPGATGDISFDIYGNPVKEAVILKISNGLETFHKRIGCPKRSAK